jgi:RND family efflux transporter MFP subunit
LNGLVTSKNVEVGQLASPGTVLFTIEDGRNYRLEATVEESRMKYISISQKVDVRIDALDENLVGKIAEIVPVADPTSRSFTVKIDLPSHPQLRSGLFGRVQFPAEPRELVTVPAESLVSRGQLSAVYVVDMDEKARFHLVKTGKTFGKRVEIISGLEEGDRVVIQPIDQVQDGQPVVILESAANRPPEIEDSIMTVAGGHV